VRAAGRPSLAMPTAGRARPCTRRFSVLLAAMVALGASRALASGGVAEPSLSAAFPGFGEVRITTRSDLAASPPTAGLVLEDETGEVVYRFPDLPGVEDDYAYYRTAALGLEDVDSDGRDDVIAIVELVTGIGPGGADPFAQAGVYLQRDNGFERATTLEQLVNTPPVYGSWSGIEGLSTILKENWQN
jgi:hypothetical protein